MTARPSSAAQGHGWTLLIRYGAPCLIYLAAAPFGARAAASVWLAVVLGLLTVRNHAEGSGRESVRAATEGVLGVAYAVAALDLLQTGNTAAEVLATAMLGVGLFATLIRDYRNTPRLSLNVTPYLVAIVIMQAGAILAAVRHGRADVIATIVAAPLLVGNIFMIMHRDLKAAHRKLALALVQAQDAARAKADFLANMSHEIRTPLNAVLGYASLLESSTRLGDEDLDQVRAIKVGGADLLAVVNDILDASRLEAGKMTVSPRATHMAHFLRESVHLFQPLAASKSLMLRLELSGALPDHLLIDDGRLRQVLSNLIGNALKFTSAGEVVVRAAYGRTAHELAIEVEDTGVGIDEGDLPGLFERFVQADSRPAQRFGGSGLGLSIARGLISLMGGHLSATSRLGVGSTFRIALPAQMAEAPTAAASAPALHGSAGASHRILVVDDHAANRRLVRTILRSREHDVEEASGGQEAVHLLRTQPFDLVLMDLNMPVIDGYESATLIRRLDAPISRLPIIAVSADVMPEQVRRCLEVGFDDHLAKPISPAALLGVVDRWLASPDGAALEEPRAIAA